MEHPKEKGGQKVARMSGVAAGFELICTNESR